MNDVNYLIQNGIDVNSALTYLGDMEAYDETLVEFVNLSNDKIGKLASYKISGDYNNYGIVAHAIKSDARYLGFTSLITMALNNEEAGKASNKEFIDANFDAFINEINRIVTIAKTYLGDKANVVSEQSAPQEEVASANTTSPTKAVLVVDDSEMIRKFISNSIDHNEYEILQADDGQKAIEIIENDSEGKIKAIFLDLNMPGINGFEVLKYFDEHKLFSKYPISIVTGADDKESINKSFNYQIIDMLVKPFTEDDVRRILERTVSFK